MFKFVKMILSLILVLIVGFAIGSLFKENGPKFTVAIGVSAGCIFLLAMQWAGKQLQTNRFGGLGTMFFGLYAIGLGLSIASDKYPKVCDMPRPGNCLSMNTVADVGGSWLVAAPALAFGIFFVVVAVGLFRQKSAQ